MRVRHRLLLVLIGVALASGLVMAVGTVRLIRDATLERYAERLRAETALLAGWAAATAGQDPQELAQSWAARLGVRVTLIGRDGTVLADSAKDRAELASMANHAERAEVRAARLGGTGESLRRSDSTNVDYYYSARSVDGAGPLGFVRVALPTFEIYGAQSRLAWRLLPLLLIMMALLIVPAYVAVRRLSHPMERLADAVERSAGGDLRFELPHHGGREIERLSQAVRQMRAAALEKIHQLDSERSVFASVISGMREGLIVVGADRRVRFVNDALRRVLELEFDPRGRLLEEVLRHPVVLRDMELALEQGREVGTSAVRLPGSGRSFQLQVTPLGGVSGSRAEAALGLLYDITKLERLEAVRREFVANVSHELRTPLTSIVASVETLLDGALDDQTDARRFLEIIRKHAGRMGDLIEDLTDLSLIETGAVTLRPEQLDLGDVVRGVVEHLAPFAANRGIRIEVDLPAPLLLTADRRRLEQVLTNLIDNAIKFNEADGRIVIRGRPKTSGVTLTVEDSGIGIPADSLEKVFHRFHQISRDRSQELRGTGLGLAIVKHLMRIHGGSVHVESELGQGSRFTIELP